MLQIWESNLFTQDMMTEWTERAPADKLYGNAVSFFNGKIAGIEVHEAAIGNTSGQNGFSKANAVTNIVSQVVKRLQGFKEDSVEGFEKRDTAIAMAVAEFKGGLSEARGKMGDIKNQLASILAALSNSRKRTRVVEESYDASDSSKETPVRPPPRKAKKHKKGSAAHKKPKYSNGGDFAPVMK